MALPEPASPKRSGGDGPQPPPLHFGDASQPPAPAPGRGGSGDASQNHSANCTTGPWQRTDTPVSAERNARTAQRAGYKGACGWRGEPRGAKWGRAHSLLCPTRARRSGGTVGLRPEPSTEWRQPVRAAGRREVALVRQQLKPRAEIAVEEHAEGVHRRDSFIQQTPGTWQEACIQDA